MPLDAGGMGREMDESVCNGTDRADAGYHRSLVVARTPLPYYLAQPQYALYRIGNRNTDALCDLAAMGGKDTERLQDLPASD